MNGIDLGTIFLVAFLGSIGHCIGMCGGFIMAYSAAKIDREWNKTHQSIAHFLYNIGRVVAYMIIGAVFGLLGKVFSFSMASKGVLFLFIGILMVLMADFFRYWLHRLSHEWMPLWRLHAVHHSPHKLYSMNVGRFHPLEKSIQFIFDALPFIILGITENVLALYFVFYSINGFFQHCNIKIYLGPLNYVISGPELHRWHHSVKIKESNKNFGNNLIVWDLLFGTWHLPKAKKVEQLGLINRNYPLGLIEQLKSPFINGLDQKKDD